MTTFRPTPGRANAQRVAAAVPRGLRRSRLGCGPVAMGDSPLPVLPWTTTPARGRRVGGFSGCGMTHAAILLILLCGPADTREDAPADACEHGEIRARSCAVAERYIRAGMRAGQVLHILACQEAPAA